MTRTALENVVAVLLPAETRWFLYVLVGGITFALAWRFATAPRRRTVADPPLTAIELACVRNRQAPVVVALAQLRAGGHVSAVRQMTGPPLPPDTDPFVRAVHAYCDGLSSYTVTDVVGALSDELDALEGRVTARGLLRTGADRWRMRLGAAPVTAAAVGGAITAFARVIVLGQEKLLLVPGVLVPSLITAIVVAPHLWSVGRGTRAGKRLLRAEKDRLEYLAPSRKPAWATYGAQAVALSVAVFGTAALWQFDGAFAGNVELAGSAEASSDGGSCGGASCGGDGGGCGGGGCGGCGGCGG